MQKTVFILLAAILFVFAKKEISEKDTASTNDNVLTIDGPYVMYSGDSIHVHYIDSVNAQLNVRKESLSKNGTAGMQLTVQTDEPGKTFTVKLRTKHNPEKSTYSKAKKMLVISDIEGEFTAFRKLLQGNGVMDNDYNWIFGDGHLVLNGDFVDRGDRVTEVLWLIYSLEEKAEVAGGKVHFILGNHEIMNMNGYLDYVHPKYINHAGIMQMHYISLFGPNSEMGRWFGSKNISEKIGNILFCHAGYSSYMNMAQFPLKGLNDTARLYYSDTSMKYPSIYSDLIFSEDGPFWYRGYYTGPQRATVSQVDSTLAIYDSRTVVTGHTMISKEIVSLFKGKVINTDTHHKKGQSEALVIEGNKMYRVNPEGTKMEITGYN